jgi:hypothetical protein
MASTSSQTTTLAPSATTATLTPLSEANDLTKLTAKFEELKKICNEGTTVRVSLILYNPTHDFVAQTNTLNVLVNEMQVRIEHMKELLFDPSCCSEAFAAASAMLVPLKDACLACNVVSRIFDEKAKKLLPAHSTPVSTSTCALS